MHSISLWLQLCYVQNNSYLKYTLKDAVQMDMTWSIQYFLGSPERSLEQLSNCINSCFHLILGMKIFINSPFTFQFVFLSWLSCKTKLVLLIFHTLNAYLILFSLAYVHLAFQSVTWHGLNFSFLVCSLCQCRHWVFLLLSFRQQAKYRELLFWHPGSSLLSFSASCLPMGRQQETVGWDFFACSTLFPLASRLSTEQKQKS